MCSERSSIDLKLLSHWFCFFIAIRLICSCFWNIFQRSKFVRKPLGGSNRATSTTIMQDSEFRSNMAHLLDTEAERNRLLARNGYGSDWRSDSTTPSSLQKRTLSAHGQRKEGTKDFIASTELYFVKHIQLWFSDWNYFQNHLLSCILLKLLV